jgi:hypothetical protein
VAARYWTVDEANESIERVGALVARAQVLLAELRDSTRAAVASSNGNGHRPPSGAGAGLEAIVAALDAEGIVLRDIEQGLIDFSARTSGGREYWLCWLVGEPTVAWWHWPEDGFAGRTPLTEPPE